MGARSAERPKPRRPMGSRRSSSDNDEVDVVRDEESNERREIRHEELTAPAFRSSVANRWRSHSFKNRCSTVSFKFSRSRERSIFRLYASITGIGLERRCSILRACSPLASSCHHGRLLSRLATHEASKTRVWTGRFFEGRRSRLPRKFRISKPIIEPSAASE